MFACKIIFAQQFGNHIEDIMRLEVVNGVRKDYRRWPIEEGDRKELVFELSSEVVVNNIDPKMEENRYYRHAYTGDWICRDDHGYWRLYTDEEYQRLPQDGIVAKPTNRATRRQILAILCAKKIEEDFNRMSYEEKLAFAEKYPDLVTKTSVPTAQCRCGQNDNVFL